MKIFLSLILASMSTSIAYAAQSETKISELEARLKALEKVVTEKLGDCQLNYKHHAYRLNRCDAGTFVRSITNVGGDTYQLECGYYQLDCQ